MFLFLGAYGQDLIEFSSVRKWWNDQRMWLVRGLSSDLFGTLEYISNQLGVGGRSFNVTNKVDDEEMRKRYNQGKFEFGVSSPMFVPLSMAAIINLVAFLGGVFQFLRDRGLEGMLGQMIVTSMGVANSIPVYEAMVLRSDGGRMPTKITIISLVLVSFMFLVVSSIANI